MVKKAFVIMPFSKTASCSEAQWTEIFADVFQPAFRACGYECERAKPSIGNLTGSIVEQLRTSPVVLADLTDHNANVFYELGVRHSLRRGTIIVAQNADHVPSDLRGYWFLRYGIRPAEVRAFRTEIARLVGEIEREPNRSDNPVADYLEREHDVVAQYTLRSNVKKLLALKTELTGNVLNLRSQGEHWYVSYGCLELLLHTMYIDPGPELLQEAYEIWHGLKTIERTGSRQTFDMIPMRIEHFHSEISRIAESLRSGRFSEPSAVSSLVWSDWPAPEDLGTGSATVMRCEVRRVRRRSG